MLCDKFIRPSWIKLLPQEEVDSDAFDEELHKGLRKKINTGQQEQT